MRTTEDIMELRIIKLEGDIDYLKGQLYERDRQISSMQEELNEAWAKSNKLEWEAEKLKGEQSGIIGEVLEAAAQHGQIPVNTLKAALKKALPLLIL